MVRVGRLKLRTRRGTIKFRSAGAMKRYEAYNRALKHGWRPRNKRKKI